MASKGSSCFQEMSADVMPGRHSALVLKILCILFSNCGTSSCHVIIYGMKDVSISLAMLSQIRC